ncbi:MAG: hypothetical protein IJB79_00785 [Candidatus Gastranaerophilales bacterium]|nr:hypothetical protein [bacterium]MBQ4645861.1 hypothetical protein [Candidatus Gastranaerophilales bacterium]
MKTGCVLCLMAIFGFILMTKPSFANARYYNNPYFATDSRYDYMYANPPRHSLGAYGRYIMSSSKVRYVHSPSRLKGVRHAAKINAYNMQAYGY